MSDQPPPPRPADDPHGFHVPNICDACRRLLDSSAWALGDDGLEPACTSFPAGIPEDILEGADHRTSRSGELPFELDPAKEVAFEDWLAFAGASR